LVSVGQLARQGFYTVLDDPVCEIKDRESGELCMRGRLMPNRLYQLCSNESEVCAMAVHGSLDLWHQRLGHLGVRSLELLRKENLVEGLEIEGDVKELEFLCWLC